MSDRDHSGMKSTTSRTNHTSLTLEVLEPRLLLNSVPTLPGLHPVDPDSTRLEGQVILLDFDGAEDVDYHGPVEINGIDVPAFVASGSLAGQENVIIAKVAGKLNTLFAGAGIEFVTSRPPPDTTYSTVFIGGDSSAFSSYGNFSGLAEDVDSGNTNLQDNAFVFANSIEAADIDGYADNLGALVAHEAAHLLGYAHDAESIGSGPLGSVAASITSQIDYSGSNQSKSVTVNLGDSVRCLLNGIFSAYPWDHFDTRWYFGGSYQEVDISDVGNGFWDPEYTRTFSTGGSFQIEADVFKNDSYVCWNIWNVTVLAPEVDVQGNGISISDGDTSPSTSDGTNFGNVDTVSGSVTRTFTIRNTGTGALTVGSVSVSNTTDFSVVSQPSSSVSAGSSTTFQVRFDPASTGTKTATVSFTNNDGNESPYDFAIQGVGTAPEVDVQGNGISISDGDSSPSTSDGTDFGSVDITSGSVTRTFTIRNTGTGTLTLGSVSVSNTTDFSIVSQPSSSISAGNSTTFQVRFDPASTGTKTATVSFTNNDNNESSYDFRIQGVGTAKPDLVVDDININGQTNLSLVTIRTGDEVTIDALSRNAGNASSNASVPYKWWWGYSSGDRYQQITNGNGNDVDGTIAGVNGLQPGEDEWVSEVVIGGIDPDNWIVNLAPGTYWLTFDVDSPSANDEHSESNNSRSEQFVVADPPADGKFMAIVPWQFEKNQNLPVILAYKDYPDFYLPDLNYATVKIGVGGSLRTVNLYAANGTNLNTGGVTGHSIEFSDAGDAYYEICNDADWWYTLGYIRWSDFADLVAPGSATTDLTVTVEYNWKWESWWPGGDSSTTVASTAEFVGDLPSWSGSGWGWYAGDTHFHSALTDIDTLIPTELFEYGSPLAVARILAENMGLTWLTITDHSYDLDGNWEPEFAETTPYDDPDVFMPLTDYLANPIGYSWGNLALDPAFSTGTSQFFKGEEISIGVEPGRDSGPSDTWAPQLHLLAYGFPSTASYVLGPGWAGLRSLTDVMGSLSTIGGAMFAYAAHPVDENGLFGEPWTLGDVTTALGYSNGLGDSILRGFEFWNGKTGDGWDIQRGSAMSLWESALTSIMSPIYSAADKVYQWFLAGGSDDHLSHYLDGGTRMSDVRTVAVAPSSSSADILSAFYNGHTIVTDGPWFTMGVDMNGDGDIWDFGMDAMPGDQRVATMASQGILRFAWPDQSSTPWLNPSVGDIRIWHYDDEGNRDASYITPSSGTWDAFADWSPTEDGTGWQCYRAELTMAGYTAYSNPIWLYFDVQEEVPTIQIADVSMTEGNSGTKDFNFTVSLSNPSSQTVTVNYGTADSSAVAPGDYTPVSGQLTFAPGQTSRTISVQVKGDTTVESNEQFYVLLSGAANATISDNQGIGTIQNDDLPAGSPDVRLILLDSPTAGLTATSLPGPAELHIVEDHGFYGEVWVRSSAGSPANIGGGSVNLSFSPAYGRIVLVEPINANWTGGSNGAVDNTAGTLTGLTRTDATPSAGDNEWVLFARVQFSGKAPVDETSYQFGPYDLAMSMTLAEFSVSGEAYAANDAGSDDAQVYAVIYDVDDSGRILGGDFGVFSAAYRTTVGGAEPPYSTWADFDGSGRVLGGDFGMLSGVYRKYTSEIDFGDLPSRYRPVGWSSGPSVRVLSESTSNSPIDVQVVLVTPVTLTPRVEMTATTSDSPGSPIAGDHDVNAARIATPPVSTRDYDGLQPSPIANARSFSLSKWGSYPTPDEHVESSLNSRSAHTRLREHKLRLLEIDDIFRVLSVLDL